MTEQGGVRVSLRDISEADLPRFFEDQLDEEANLMAAFTPKDPHDREAFDPHWLRLLADETIVQRTILADKAVAGHIAAFGSPDLDGREITYWIGRAFWGQGVATRALRLLLEQATERPLYARCAKTNPASLRVLEKCGFTVAGEDSGYANAHGKDIEEYVLRLDGGLQ